MSIQIKLSNVRLVSHKTRYVMKFDSIPREIDSGNNVQETLLTTIHNTPTGIHSEMKQTKLTLQRLIANHRKMQWDNAHAHDNICYT